MFKSFFKAVKSAFGFDGVGESALKIVDKIAGTDWTAKEKAQFILDHAEKTKYQSPTRRLMAALIIIKWFTMGIVWLLGKIAFRIFDKVNAGLLSDDIQAYMVSDVNILVSSLMAFYFLAGLKK